MGALRRVLRQERGANLVEFAILAPLLILLVIGIVEFGWLFAENLDVKHGAREGARMAATDDFPNPLTPATDVCARMDTANISGDTEITIQRSGDNIGDTITVTVDAPADTITGLLDWAIPSTTRLVSVATVRLEQAPNWSTITTVTCP